MKKLGACSSMRFQVCVNLVKVAQEIFVHFNMKNLTFMAIGNVNEETDDEDFDTEVECDYCYFETKSKSELMMHVDIEPDLSCVFCEYKAITMLDLKEHKINNH